MRYIADENFPRPAILWLRAESHDVLSVAESSAGLVDAQVLQLAVSQGRILLTLDSDFGELIYRLNHPPCPGIVLFRLHGTSPQEDVRRIIQILSAPLDPAGHFTTVTDRLVRTRPLADRPP